MKKFTPLSHLVLSIIFSSAVFSSALAQVNQQIPGITKIVKPGKTETVNAIKERAKAFPDVRMIQREELKYPDRSHLRQNPLSKPISSFPERINDGQKNTQNTSVIQPSQTIGLSFNGVTGPTETGAFPPDNMGAVGPTQYIMLINGRLRSFNKTTGVADGVLNVNPDAFFASVMTTGTGVINGTSDPRIRYDRLSGKWILVMIDVPRTATNTFLTNRILIAFSNDATITGSTSWTFSQFTGEASRFTDYPTLGIDINALYIGANMFTLPPQFSGTNGYVINRAALLSGGAYSVTTFNLQGVFTPQGVDNFDVSATGGYFIGASLTNGTLRLRKVSDPGGSPTISGNISLTVPTTLLPRNVPHLGNIGGNLDAIGDRLSAAVIRNGHLWTSHNIGVDETGVASNGSNMRDGVRWYDITNLATTPSLNQSGTIFDNNSTVTSARDYFIPSVMISGQGHAVFSLTTAGTSFYANAAMAGRLSNDALGTTQTPVLTTASSTSYNPGTTRWGDYSNVSVDPLDDMTLWMINQYCVGTNLYGCNITKIIAPPPATPSSCSPASVLIGQASVDVIVTGTIDNGSGFFDPGANLPAPALPFNHIAASVSGGIVVNSITYTDPTHVTLNLNTTASTSATHTITITNPDGQSLTSGFILTSACAVFSNNRAYVNANATGANNGTTWADAFTNLQSALAITGNCGITEIWVAAGTYKPTATIDRNISFVMNINLAIYGGFNGTETLLSQRDWGTNVTILSGDIDGDNTIANNAYHVTSGSGTNSTALLDGFTITGGNAICTGACGVGGQWGGGMLNISGSPTVTNCIFSSNIAAQFGGGMANINSSPIITSCIFLGNSYSLVISEPHAGGGMFNQGSSPVLVNCIFSGNSAGSAGGGMYNTTTRVTGQPTIISAPTITNCTFSGNSAFFNSSGSSAGGGLASASGSSATLSNSIFWNNRDNSGIGTATASINGTASVSYSLVQGQSPAGTGNLDGTNAANNPLFVIPVDPVTSPATSGNFHLQPGSPAINAGTNTGAPAVDIEGNVRPLTVANPADMGAYESEVVPAITVSGTFSPFTTCAGSTSVEQTFTVAGTGLSANLVITAPAGFEVSLTTGSGFAGSIVLTPSGATVNTTTIYVRTTTSASGNPSGNITCASNGIPTQSLPVNGTVNTLSIAPTGATGTILICEGGSTTLSVTGGNKGTGALTQWFTGSCGGTPAGTGDNVTISPTATTTYYVRYNGTCNTTACATVTVTVNTLSGAPTGATGTIIICNGASTTLSVTGGSKGTAATTEWFTGSCNGTSAGTGDNVTVSPTATTTYYVRYNGTCNTSTCATVTVTVNTLSAAPTGATGTMVICNGSGTTLSVSGGSKGTGATTEWFTGSCGGTSAGTGDAITVSPTATTNYYVRYKGDCNTTTCAMITVTVNTRPVLSCPANIIVNNTTGLCSGLATYTPSATGTPAATISYTFTGATTGSGPGTGSGSTFNLGVTNVTITATNTCGTVKCSFTVTVKDVQTPVINQIAKPIVLLWSPNHSYQTITASQFITSVTDNCGSLAVANVVITKVTSDELEDAPGDDDGNTINDIVIAANCKSVQLRSERMGSGNGRVYTIYVSVKDNSGNAGTATFKILVAKSQNGNTAVDNITPLYIVNSGCESTSAPTVAKQAPLISEEILQPLIQTFPNPFSKVTTIRYTLATDAHVNLGVYNNLGQKVAQLVNGRQAAGTHQANFNAAKWGAGIYQYQLQTLDKNGKAIMLSGKMVRIR